MLSIVQFKNLIQIIPIKFLKMIFVILALIVTFTIFAASPVLVSIDNLCVEHCYIIGAIYTSLIVSNLAVMGYIFKQIISIVHGEENNYWILVKVVKYIDKLLNSPCLVKMAILTFGYLIVSVVIPRLILLTNWLLVYHLLVVTYIHAIFIIIFLIGSLVF